MTSNASYQCVPTETPVVVQAVVSAPRSNDRSFNAGRCTIVIILSVIGTILMLVGGMEYGTSRKIVPSVPILVFGFIVVFGASCLYQRKGGRSTSSGRVVGPAEGGTQTVGVPVVGQVVTYPTIPAAGQVVTYPTTQAAGQVVNYPTTPATPSVSGGLVSTYTYTPPPYQYASGGQAPTYPPPGQVPAPAYPYAGGQAPSYPMDQKPPIGAPVGAHVGASASGFQAPPTAPYPYFPEYQQPPPYAPDEKPPPYSG